MKLKRRKKVFAAIVLVAMLSQTFTPVVTFALTSGPTQPEATSFEPVDTTDMVNLQTGDFTYSLPLLEVPGPEGGYPLSLSYHAGIQPNEDASWVGLGWTLNPGAITRYVNGYPDDWVQQTNSDHAYWEGGVRKELSVGFSVPLAGFGSVNYGLSFAHDTYMGFGIGEYFGVSLGIGGKGSPLSAGVGVGFSPFGGARLSGGLGVGGSLGKSGLDLQFGTSASTDFNSINAGVSGSISSMGVSLLGTSISTDDGFTASAAGYTSAVSSSKASKIQTKSSGFSLGFISFQKTRYWIDEKTNVVIHGSLDPIESPHYTNTVSDAHDAYEMLEDPDVKNIVDYPDPSMLQGGAFLDFDVYNVNAQGLGGNMRPYQFQGEAVGQNRNNGLDLQYRNTDKVGGYTVPVFRFVGDYSSTYRQTYAPFTGGSDPTGLIDSPVPFDDAPIYGNGLNDGAAGPSGVNSIGGSRYVEVGVKIQPSNALGYVKSDRYESGMIDGFSIINESGVKYTYGLPAYSYGEEVYQKKIDESNGVKLNRQTKNTPYAYTWYLTTITGPDYVDRNNNHIADSGDWGYWINFEYGKWSNDFIWRTPAEGYNKDEDNEFENCSMGHKEIYYLNAIRTRSHIALFEKSLRNDGKGESASIFHKDSYYRYDTYSNYDEASAQTLRLDRIYLLNAGDANIVTTSSGGLSDRAQDLDNNILDKADIDNSVRQTVEDKSIRIIDFNYDYSLCQNTGNSFNINAPQLKSGKLTLLNIVNRGKGGANLLPPTVFSYNLPENEEVEASGTITSVSVNSYNVVSRINSTNHNLQVGDLLETNESSPQFLGVITEIPSAGVYMTFGGGNWGTAPQSINFRKTNNPPYNKDAFDMWGMYKSDINRILLTKNENLARLTSRVSAESADAWSLRQIKTATGASMNINYESNTYSKSVISNNHSLPVGSVAKISGTEFKIVSIDSVSFPFVKYYKPGDTLDALLLQRFNEPVIHAPASGCYTTETTAWASLPTIVNVTTGTLLVRTTAAMMNKYFADSELGGRPVSLGGNLNVDFEKVHYGSGIRTASISVNSSSGDISRTKYSYGIPGVGISSGVTSYEPQVLNVDNMSSYSVAIRNEFRRKLYKNVNNIYSISRELPPPGVMYEFVTVTNELQHTGGVPAQIEGQTVYQFEVLHRGMVNRKQVTPQVIGYEYPDNNIRNTARNYVLQKFTLPVGALKKIVQYDGQGHAITETINHYLHDGINFDDSTACDQYRQVLDQKAQQFKYQGLLQERTVQLKEVFNQDEDLGIRPVGSNTGTNGYKITMSAREEYPLIQTGTTKINYINRTQTSTENVGFDFYSGAVTKTVETDAYGNRIMTEVVPAYRKYSSMGLKVSNANNLNMLSQTAGTYVYKVDADTTRLGLISASVSTWSNTIPSLGIDGASYIQNSSTNGIVWRPQYTYDWQPSNKTSDGLTPLTGFVDFWTNPANPNVGWVKTSSITRYDVFSKALEGTDINGNYVATHMNYDSRKVEVTGVSAKYGEVAFSGAEDATLTQASNPWAVKIGEGTLSTGLSNAHTGQKSLRLAAGKKGFIYSMNTGNLTSGRSYLAYAWVKPVSGSTSNAQLYYSVGGIVKDTSVSSSAGKNKAGAWTLLTLLVKGSDISGASQTLEVGLKNVNGVDIFGDDFRFQPVDGSSTAYVYDPFSGELKYILDANNLYTRFDYDAMGRLIATYNEKIGVGVFKTGESIYNYGQKLFTRPTVPPSVYAKLTLENQATETSGTQGQEGFTQTTKADLYIRFYSDASCTIPVNSDPSVTFLYENDSYHDNGYPGGVSSDVYQRSVQGNGNTFIFIGRVTLEDTYLFTDPQYGWIQDYSRDSYSLLPNEGYYVISNLYYNAAKSGTFTKNDCTSGTSGSTVVYTVPQGTYTSAVSQADADQKAQNDINVNGQAYANQNGSCSAGVTMYTNNPDALDGFWVDMVSTTDASKHYSFNISLGGPVAKSVVPIGTYTIHIYRDYIPEQDNLYDFNLSCAGSVLNQSETTYTASVTAGCSTITVNQ